MRYPSSSVFLTHFADNLDKGFFFFLLLLLAYSLGGNKVMTGGI